jgi:hypothetical protein
MYMIMSIEDRPNERISAEENYRLGLTIAENIATRVGESIQLFEASNELDNWIGMRGDGSERWMYNTERYRKAFEFLRGIISGIHSRLPKARVIVDDAGWCHYGFLHALWEDGLRWDITSLHWYASHGDIQRSYCRAIDAVAIHASFGLPVWITESNDDKAAKRRDADAQARWLESFRKQIARIGPRYGVEVVLVYELLDQPGLTNGEDSFGLFDENGRPKANLDFFLN